MRKVRSAVLILATLALAGCAHASLPVPVTGQVQSLTRTYGWSQVDLTLQVIGRYALAPDGNIYGFAQVNNFTAWGIAQVSTLGVVTTYEISGFPIDSGQMITPNPDGDIYAIEGTNSGSFDMARLSEGSITETPLQFSQNGDYPEGIVTGSDGNMWIVHYFGVAKLTPQGQWTDYLGERFPGYPNIVRGPDKNLWILGYDPDLGGNALVQVNITDGVRTPYAAPSDAHGLVQGADKNLYALGMNRVYAITTSGSFTPFAVSPTPGTLAVAASERLFWIAGKDKAFVWSTKTHNVIVRSAVPRGPCCTLGYVNGPGGDLWVFQNVYKDAQVLTSSTPSPAATR